MFLFCLLLFNNVCTIYSNRTNKKKILTRSDDDNFLIKQHVIVDGKGNHSKNDQDYNMDDEHVLKRVNEQKRNVEIELSDDLLYNQNDENTTEIDVSHHHSDKNLNIGILERRHDDTLHENGNSDENESTSDHNQVFNDQDNGDNQYFLRLSRLSALDHAKNKKSDDSNHHTEKGQTNNQLDKNLIDRSQNDNNRSPNVIKDNDKNEDLADVIDRSQNNRKNDEELHQHVLSSINTIRNGNIVSLLQVNVRNPNDIVVTEERDVITSNLDDDMYEAPAASTKASAVSTKTPAARKKEPKQNVRLILILVGIMAGITFVLWCCWWYAKKTEEARKEWRTSRRVKARQTCSTDKSAAQQVAPVEYDDEEGMFPLIRLTRYLFGRDTFYVTKFGESRSNDKNNNNNDDNSIGDASSQASTARFSRASSVRSILKNKFRTKKIKPESLLDNNTEKNRHPVNTESMIFPNPVQKSTSSLSDNEKKNNKILKKKNSPNLHFLDSPKRGKKKNKVKFSEKDSLDKI